MTVLPAIVVVYVVRPTTDGTHEILQLLRREGSYMGGTWQFPGGKIDDGERAPAAALRELREETGLTPRSFSYLTHVPTFYLPKFDVIGMAAAFCAVVDADAGVTLNAEHADARWIARRDVRRRVVWPTDRAALAEVFREHLRPGSVAYHLRRLPVDAGAAGERPID